MAWKQPSRDSDIHSKCTTLSLMNEIMFSFIVKYKSTLSHRECARLGSQGPGIKWSKYGNLYSFKALQLTPSYCIQIQFQIRINCMQSKEILNHSTLLLVVFKRKIIFLVLHLRRTKLKEVRWMPGIYCTGRGCSLPPRPGLTANLCSWQCWILPETCTPGRQQWF